MSPQDAVGNLALALGDRATNPVIVKALRVVAAGADVVEAALHLATVTDQLDGRPLGDVRRAEARYRTALHLLRMELNDVA